MKKLFSFLIKKRVHQIVAILLLSVVIGFSLQVVSADWSPPGNTPPLDNVALPMTPWTDNVTDVSVGKQAIATTFKLLDEELFFRDSAQSFEALDDTEMIYNAVTPEARMSLYGSGAERGSLYGNVTQFGLRDSVHANRLYVDGNGVQIPFSGDAKDDLYVGGALDVDGGILGSAMALSHGAPAIKFNDTTPSADDYWIHVNSNRMYFLRDENDDDDWTDSLEVPYPLWLDVNGAHAPGFMYTSDRRLKKNIVVIDDSLTKISQLDGVSFDWKHNNESNLGLIAQVVEQIFPEIVDTDKESGMKSVAYGNLVAPIIEAIKELSKKLDNLFDKYLDQQDRIDSLEERLELLENK